MSFRSRPSSSVRSSGSTDWVALCQQVREIYSVQPDPEPSFAPKVAGAADPLDSLVVNEQTLLASPLCLHKDWSVDVLPCPDVFTGPLSHIERCASLLRQVFGQVRLSFIGELINHYDARKRPNNAAANQTLNSGAQSLLRSILRGDLFGLGSQSDSGIFRHTTDGTPQALTSPDFVMRWDTSCSLRIARLRMIRPDTHLLFLCSNWPNSCGRVILGYRNASILPVGLVEGSIELSRQYESLLSKLEPVDELALAPYASQVPVKQREIIVQALCGGGHSTHNIGSQVGARDSSDALSTRTSPRDIPGQTRGSSMQLETVRSTHSQAESAASHASSGPPVSYSSAARSSAATTAHRSTRTNASSTATIRPGGMIFLDTNIWTALFEETEGPDPSRVQNVLHGVQRAGSKLLLTGQLLRELQYVCPSAWKSILLVLRAQRGVIKPSHVKILRDLPVRSGRCYTATKSKEQNMAGDALLLAEIASAARSQARASQTDNRYRIYSGDKIFLLRSIEFRFPSSFLRSCHFLGRASEIPKSSTAWQALFQRDSRESNLPVTP